jgi:hypothetical protein
MTTRGKAKLNRELRVDKISETGGRCHFETDFLVRGGTAGGLGRWGAAEADDQQR